MAELKPHDEKSLQRLLQVAHKTGGQHFEHSFFLCRRLVYN